MWHCWPFKLLLTHILCLPLFPSPFSFLPHLLSLKCLFLYYLSIFRLIFPTPFPFYLLLSHLGALDDILQVLLTSHSIGVLYTRHITNNTCNGMARNVRHAHAHIPSDLTHASSFHHTSLTKLKLKSKIAKNSMMVTVVHRIMGVSFLAQAPCESTAFISTKPALSSCSHITFPVFSFVFLVITSWTN